MDAIAVPIWAITAALSAITGLAALRDLRRRFLSAVLFLGYAVVYGLAPIFLYWRGGPRLGVASMACFLGWVGLLAGRSTARRLLGEPQTLDLKLLLEPQRRRARVMLLCGALGVAGVFMFSYGSAGSVSAFLASTRFQYRLAPAHPLVEIVGVFLIPYTGVPIAMLITRQSRPQRNLALLAGLGLAAALFSFMKGERSIPTGLLALFLLLWLAYNPRATANRNDGPQLSVVVGSILAGFAVMTLLPALHQARASDAVGITSVATTVGTSRSESFFDREPTNYSNILVAVVDKFPGTQQFLWFYPVRRLVLFPLKSGGIKPPDTNKVVAATLGRGENETTIPPSLPGEGYVVMGGLLGVAPWVALYGFGLGAIEARMGRRVWTITVMAIGGSASLLALRGQFYELVIAFLVTAAVARFVDRVSGARKRATVGTSPRWSGALARR